MWNHCGVKRWGRFVWSPPDINSFFEVVTLPVGLHPFLPAYLTFSFSDKHTQQCEVKLHVLYDVLYGLLEMV
jgi:hypothetical protein